LFDIDKFDWGTYAEQDFLTRLAGLKRLPAMRTGYLVWMAAEPAVQAVCYCGQESLYGLFNVSGQVGEVNVALPDGTYQNLLDDSHLVVKSGSTTLPECGFVTAFHCAQPPQDFFAPLLDYLLVDGE
jgi:hypothetical protein